MAKGWYKAVMNVKKDKIINLLFVVGLLELKINIDISSRSGL
jgi:hypothetical protein